MKMAGPVGVVLPFLFALGLFPVAQAHTSFIFDQFNASSLTLLGNVSIQSNAICLTNQSQHIFGRALFPQPVLLKAATLSFSTTFVFTIVPSSSDRARSGAGMAFIITSHKYPVGVSTAQFLGLFNISSVGQAYNRLFAIEFDTVQNEEFQDIDDNHVGVDLNDLTSVQSHTAGYWIGNDFQKLDLNILQNIQAWIDYDHMEKQLNVTIVQAGSLRPTKPLISLRNMTLASIVQDEMYVGFSAATGTLVEDHCVLAWSFSTNGSAPVLDISHLPSFIRKNSSSRLITGITTTLVLLILLVVATAVFQLKRKKYRDVIEEWEKEFWPQRFNYKHLHIATNGFRDDHLLGSGGFGRVYRGVLPTNGLEVAVKCIHREMNEGMKEFIAEISSLGRLQHRNLVQIRGYCRWGTQLFIVYEYMPNGSLDKMIFGKPKKVLGWGQRYKILRDVAAGLLYLHEGWEQRVVHRDIKSSNVLLDSELNGKLGDFGLARLYEHNENPHTTRLVGTLGYIAPELIRTGKAIPATDVFSFGILMLEVACGRRPVDSFLDVAKIVMVDWVRELYVTESLMDAADPHLGGEYIADEMEKVLKLGLLCSNPQAEGRLGMREVVQILEEEAASIPGFDAPVYLETSTPNSTWKSALYYSGSNTDASISRSLEVR